jgi:hypothetical protein
MNRWKGKLMSVYDQWVRAVDDLPLARRLVWWATGLLAATLIVGVLAVWVCLR